MPAWWIPRSPSFTSFPRTQDVHVILSSTYTPDPFLHLSHILFSAFPLSPTQTRDYHLTGRFQPFAFNSEFREPALTSEHEAHVSRRHRKLRRAQDGSDHSPHQRSSPPASLLMQNQQAPWIQTSKYCVCT